MAIILRLQKGSPLTNAEVDGNFTDLDGRVTAAKSVADAAQPKVAGKGLSTNDYDNTEKAKVANAQPKEAGKGLSTNDYDNAEKSKVANAIPSSQKGIASGVATLGADGKLPVSQLPPLAVNEVFTVANQAAMLALTAERGDAAIRTDQNGQWYILTADAPSALANWKPISQNLGIALTALGALTPAADTMPYFNGTSTAANTALTAKARTLLGFTTNSQWQSELALVPVTGFTDITAGRLLTPGWMGFGSLSGLPLPGANANVNTLASGRYSTTATWTGSPFSGTDGLNQGYLEVHPWEASNYVKQTWSSIISGVATYVRYKVNNVWGAWTPFFDPNNSASDPSVGFGLMSMTTVSGFTVFKYLNGQMIVQGPIPTTANIAANTQFTVSVAIPVTFPVGSVTLVGTLYPSVGNDFAIRNTQAPGSTAYLFCANGASAQTFSGNLMLVGRWK